MRVRCATYPVAFMIPGGGEIQLLKTLRAVADRGFDIDRFDYWKPFGGGQIDILHVFSVCNSVELYANICKQLGVRFIVSPILWPTDYDVAERNRIRHILLSADAILPNSLAEKRRIIEVLDIPDEGQFFVVPNGVDAGFFRGIRRSESLIQSKQVVCVANVDRRKNIRVLAKACSDLDLQLTLYGQVRDQDYFDEIVLEFGGVFDYRGKFQHGSEAHVAILQAARVFALASDYETPGLAAIEAGAAGVPIVVTNVGSAPEYFGDYANYCDPSSTESVREALRESLLAPAVLDDKARDHFAGFTWEQAGQATITAYQCTYKTIKSIDAAALPSKVGISVGSSKVADPEFEVEQGHVTYGPYATYRPGTYSVTVYYQSPASVHDVVSHFEVIVGNPDCQAFASEMLGTNGNAVALTFQVDFKLKSSGVQFRIFWFGRFKLVVEKIETKLLG
jgi:glycosyltransferase involved in cell wall biosynthesis